MRTPLLLVPVLAGALFLASSAASGGAPQQTSSLPTPAAAPAPAPALDPQATPAAGAIKIADSMKNPVKPTAQSQAKAKEIYSIDCSMCHGDDGKGKTDLVTSMSLTMSDFTDPKSLAGHMDGEIFNVIRKGKGKMPGEDAARANDNQVWNLVLYVRGFSKPSSAIAAAPATPAQ